MDSDGTDARTRKPRVWLCELVPEYREEDAAGGGGVRGVFSGEREQCHLYRLGHRHRRGGAVDSWRRRTEWVRCQNAGVAPIACIGKQKPPCVLVSAVINSFAYLSRRL